MTSTPTLPLQIEYDRYAFKINGQPTVIRSAAMHYFRLPGEDMWRDRLYKLKAAGYNTLDLYFCWAFHSPEQGVYDFTGVRDVRRLLEIVAEMGFYLIARPGPYINAEYTGGGLPGWLLARKDVVLRNRDQDGNHVWSEPYMAAVTEWWDQIIPFIRDYPYLLMMQIENEYATSDMEPDYMQALYQMSRERGITVPLMHNDMYAAGLFEDVVDIYAFDNYSVTSFESDWRDADGVFGILDHLEDSMRPYCQERPLMVAELQAGWFGGWKGYPYELIVEQLGREHIGIVTKSLLAQGLTVFSHYKGVGGTNWGYMGSTDVYTSYDFGAPISESGVNTERLFEAKALNLFLDAFDLSCTDRVSAPPFALESLEAGESAESCLYAVRQTVSAKGGDMEMWLFVRNLAPTSVQNNLVSNAICPTAITVPMGIKAHGFKILPVNVRLASGDTLVFSTAELLHQTASMLVVRGEDLNVLLFNPVADGALSRLSEGVTSDLLACGTVRVEVDLTSATGMAHFRIGELSVFVLGEFWAERLWKESDGTLVSGADARLSTGEYGLKLPFEEMLCLSPNGQLTMERQVVELTEAERPFETPLLLSDWTSTHHAPQLFTSQGFMPVSPHGADLDSNGYYEGAAWYRYDFEGKTPTSVTVFARHIWGVFLNGEFVGEGHHWSSVKDPTVATPHRLMIPAGLVRADGHNELCLFVDSLGHPKGFHDDAQEPQGLITLKLDDEDITLDTRIFPGIRGWTTAFKDIFGDMPLASPLVRMETTFTLPDLSRWACPVGLTLSGIPYERVNIVLNDILIGRYWKACSRQTQFYLPEGLLRTEPGEINRLELVAINFNPMVSVAEAMPTTATVAIEPYQCLLRYER